MPDAVVTSRLPPSTKVVRLKSTCSWRESACVVEPHSRSTLPPATAVIRLSDVTPTHLIWICGSPRLCWSAPTTCRHRSIEYPVGDRSAPTNENGTAESR